MNRRVRAVIVGAGLFGTKRLRACLAMPTEFDVVGVVDILPDQREKIRSQFHVPTFGHISETPKDVDLAIISTPNAFHERLTVESLAHGMNVLCEKPLAPTVNECRRIIRAAKKYHKLVKTGSNHRFFPTVQKAKELFEQGTIGKLLLFKASIGINGERVANKWFWNHRMSGGGSFIDNGCHVLDIARMFMGNFTKCSAHMTNTYWKGTSVEDVGSAIFVTRDDRQAVITSSWIQWAGYLHIELWGEKGYIIIDSTTHDIVTMGNKEGVVTTYDYSNEPKDSYHRELLYMKRCILTKTDPHPDAMDGSYVIGMIESAYRSSQKKSWTTIRP